MINFFYKVIVEAQEEGGFTAYIPSLPGCVSEGETYDETIANIKEALNLYVETLKIRQKEIIKDKIHITEMCVSV